MKREGKSKLLAAAILTSGLLAGNSTFAATYTSTVTQAGPTLVDGDWIMITDGSSGILSSGSGGLIGDTITPPNNIVVIVENANNTANAGILASGLGNQVVLGDGTEVRINGTNARAVRSSEGGSIVLGKETKVTSTGTDARGVYAISTTSGATSQITLGNDANITVQGTDKAFGIFAEGNAQIKIADNGTSGSGLYLDVSRTGTGQLRGVRATNSGSEIDLGNNATVKVTGDNGWGVSANSNGQVYAGAGLSVTTQGDGS